MKKLVIPLLILFVFMYIFIQSNTMEMYQEGVRMEDGALGYTKTRYTLRWDRFIDYTWDIPGKIERQIDRWKRSF